MADLTPADILQQVEAEMRPGGRPYAKYQELDVVSGPKLLGQVLTSRIIRNFEERIVALEEQRCHDEPRS